MLILSAVVGFVAGLGAILFYMMLDVAKHFILGGLAGYYPPTPIGEPPLFEHPEGAPFRRWVLLVLPALGGVLSGWVVYRFAPEAEGHGTDAAIESYHLRGGRVRARVPLVKAIASALTIGSGGSGGREGPIAQIGSGFGSTLASLLRLSTRERRILMAAGMAGGVGAIFRAPMAGALFAAEVLYRDLDLEYEVIIPSIISSIVAYAVFAMRFGWHALFVTPRFVFERPAQLLAYAVLAGVVALGAWIYIRAFYGAHDWFKRSRIPPRWRPAVGGLLVGIIGFVLPAALCTGYGTLQSALWLGTPDAETFGRVSLGLLLAVALGKIATTALSIGSGGSGGVFGPAIVIGGALGGAVGLAASQLAPALHIQPGAFALVGMAAFFAAAAKTPISTIIMVSEMTGSYGLLVPSLWTCILAYLLLTRVTLYVKQIHNRFNAPVHMGNMAEGVLRNITVAAALRHRTEGTPLVVGPHTGLQELLTHFAELRQSAFPVVDEDKRVLGMIQGRDLRAALMPGTMHGMIIAEDLMVPPVTVTPRDSLLTALNRMVEHGRELVVVVEASDRERVLATLSHAEILAAYHAQLMQAG